MKTLVAWNVAIVVTSTLFLGSVASAGPYSTAMANDPAVNPGAPDAGIPGFVGPEGDGITGNGNVVNPQFVGWATVVVAYDPFDLEAIQNYANGLFAHPEKALGPVTGNHADVVCLGDMTADELAAWRANPATNHGPGRITLSFARAITNGTGPDFAVFENGLISQGGAGAAGQLLAELAYVEVSTNGADFVRFPSVSQTASPVAPYGTIDSTDVYNLAGKHANGNGFSWGTPFDLNDLADEPAVVAGLVDLAEIHFVRMVDIPGDGSFVDSLDQPVYDAWPTWGSGGLDLEAVGVLHQVPEPGTLAAVAAALGTLGLGQLVRLRRRHNRRDG
ncbi:MAG: PEP-CTERM sorting domain-containing protein [Pirellulales bacterium]|nr:PEP-CTERM sorting domain-containing protein [Pirellulales bacterium]